MRAKYVKTLRVARDHIVFLWKVHGNGVEDTPHTHVVTSATKWHSMDETMAFWADENGRVLDWRGINRVNGPYHVECLEDAGFEVVDDVEY